MAFGPGIGNWKRKEIKWHTLFVRILKNMIVDERTGCWLYTGHITDNGYGLIGWNYKRYRVHRLIAHFFHSLELDSPLDACHTCDVRRCFNPLHIVPETRSWNFKDAAAKGRWHNQYGPRKSQLTGIEG